MSDSERYEVLSNRKITITAKADATRVKQYSEKLGIGSDMGEGFKQTERHKLIVKLGEEFGIFKNYQNNDFQVEVEFTKSGLKESEKKQRERYDTFCKLLSCMDEVIENAVGIEVHNRNAQGYKPNPELKNAFVLASAFEDNDVLYPVKLEVKEYLHSKNKLYVLVALHGIKKDEVVKEWNTVSGVTKASRSSAISIADFFRCVNPHDVSLLKYIPDGFLRDEQLASKRENAFSGMKTSEVLEEGQDEQKQSAVRYGESGERDDGIGAAGSVSEMEGGAGSAEEARLFRLLQLRVDTACSAAVSQGCSADCTVRTPARSSSTAFPMLVLDEPTAALDPVSEYEIYSRFNSLVGERTAVYISHRLASCRFCDTIAVFDQGQLIQSGSHQALLRQMAE